MVEPILVMSPPLQPPPISQNGRALVRAIEGISAILPSAWFERAIAGLLLAAYKPRLRAITAAARARMGGGY
jgi:hypothetical protein